MESVTEYHQYNYNLVEKGVNNHHFLSRAKISLIIPTKPLVKLMHCSTILPSPNANISTASQFTTVDFYAYCLWIIERK